MSDRGGQQITSFFTLVQGPVPAAQENPSAWLPPDCDRSRLTRRLRDGTLMGTCSNGKRRCNRVTKTIECFAPGDNHRGVRRRAPFFEALASYERALRNRDIDSMAEQRKVIEGLMKKKCKRCRDISVKSQNRSSGPIEACKVAYSEILDELGGQCDECGTVRALSIEHVDPSAKMRDEHGKPIDIGNKHWWSHNGGPKAMRAEVADGKCIVLCIMCHRLRATGCVGRRIGTVKGAEALPDARPCEDRKAYSKKHHALVTAPRYEYNDWLKRDTGRCCNPACPADGPGYGNVAQHEVCYDWNHINPNTKPTDPHKTISGVCVWHKRLSEVEWKHIIDKDRELCELLCANCHHEHTHGLDNSSS